MKGNLRKEEAGKKEEREEKRERELSLRMYIIQSKLDFTYFSVSGEKYVKSGCT